MIILSINWYLLMFKYFLLTDISKSVLINVFIYFILIIISGLLKIYTNLAIGGLFLIASTVFISIYLMYSYRNSSKKERLSFKECFILGFLVGSITWFIVYLAIALPNLISMISKSSNQGDLIILQTMTFTLSIFSISIPGCLTSGISLLFSPFFTKKTVDFKYIASWISLLFLAFLLTICLFVFILLPVFNRIIINISDTM